MSMYCPYCRVWAYKNHKCPQSKLVLTARELKDSVQRLHDLGIKVLVASLAYYPLFDWSNNFSVSISFDLGQRLDCEVLGELPKEWKYYWETITPDHTAVYLLTYHEVYSWCGFEDVEDRVSAIIKEFEDYLDTRNPEAIKALLALTYC